MYQQACTALQVLAIIILRSNIFWKLISRPSDLSATATTITIITPSPPPLPRHHHHEPHCQYQNNDQQITQSQKSIARTATPPHDFIPGFGTRLSPRVRRKCQDCSSFPRLRQTAMWHLGKVQEGDVFMLTITAFMCTFQIRNAITARVSRAVPDRELAEPTNAFSLSST